MAPAEQVVAEVNIFLRACPGPFRLGKSTWVYKKTRSLGPQLSIDNDGDDFWVWRALDGYRSAIVIIEHNALLPSDEVLL